MRLHLENKFSQIIINDWNSITEDIVCAESINSFKAKLDKYWQTKWYKMSKFSLKSQASLHVTAVLIVSPGSVGICFPMSNIDILHGSM